MTSPTEMPDAAPVDALYVPRQTDTWIPPLDMARRLAAEDLAVQQKANIHDREAMVVAATTLEIRLRQVLAALDTADAAKAERDGGAS